MLMPRLIIVLVGCAILAIVVPSASGQKKSKCEEGPQGTSNWDMHGQDYVYFDYTICPAKMDPPTPLVRVMITTRGQGIALEKWIENRDGVDSIVVFDKKKTAYTLFRDLNAIPLKMLSADRRSAIPATMGTQPFLARGLDLVPFQSLSSEQSGRIKKVLDDADIIIKKAQGRLVLLYESKRIVDIASGLLDNPMTTQK